MDLERIKQNLRLRSGRNKKARKPAPISIAPKAAAPAEREKNVPNGTATKAPNPAREEPSPGSGNANADVEIEKTPSHRPSLPHAATGLESGKNTQETSPPDGPADDKHHDQASTSPARPGPSRRMTDPNPSAQDAPEGVDEDDFDLRPPAPKPKPASVEMLSELLFSAGHLNTLLHEPQLLVRFTAFLNRYKREYYPILLCYLETQKALKAIEYANAVAQGIALPAADTVGVEAATTPSTAAVLDKQFEEACTSSFKTLLSSALPMYITYNLVKIASECLTNEITGRSTPMMRDLVGGLSEVFCLTDPKQDDNPIIYASEEFYRLTGYVADDVIGYNCRFLQGVKTNRESPKRLRDSVEKGEGTCETLLNYKRDGRPFVNLLMIAPLHDDKGNVKYNIGAQVDVSGLIEGGRALDGFERYLAKRTMEQRLQERARSRDGDDEETKRKKLALAKLRELSEMFDLEESAVVQSHSRSSSMSRDSDTRSIGSSGGQRTSRRLYVESDDSDSEDADEEDEDTTQDKTAWTLGQEGASGLSGKLPGIYERYMLLRPAPSLRIIFTSPKLRKLGNVVQSPFLAHVAASAGTLAGLKESFESGTPVSAKINFMTKKGERRDGTKIGGRHEDGKYGRACWISATPLVGADDNIGVWMVILVEKARAARNSSKSERNEIMRESQSTQAEDRPSRPRKIDLPPRQTSNDMKEDGAQGNSESRETREEEVPIKPTRLGETTESSEKNGDSHTPQDDSRLPKAEQEQKEGEDYEQVPKSDEATETSRGRTTTQQHDDHEGEEYVRPHQQQDHQSSSHRGDRVHIRPDSDDGNVPGTPRGNEFDLPAQTPPPESPPSVPSDAQLPDHDDDEPTPRKANVDADADADEDDFHSTHRSTSREPDSGSSKKNMLYMDYLRHPGSRNSGEYSRAHGHGGYGQNGTDEEADRNTDIDCARSPYSID